MAQNRTAVCFKSGTRPGTRSRALPVFVPNLARVGGAAVGASTDGISGVSCHCRPNPRRGSHARGRSITSRCSRPSRLSRCVLRTHRAGRPSA